MERIFLLDTPGSARGPHSTRRTSEDDQRPSQYRSYALGALPDPPSRHRADLSKNRIHLYTIKKDMSI